VNEILNLIFGFFSSTRVPSTAVRIAELTARIMSPSELLGCNVAAETVKVIPRERYLRARATAVLVNPSSPFETS
jgi:hypothetical protein